jgi:hypothetical protein
LISSIAVALKSLVMLPIAVEDFNASSCASLSNLYLALSLHQQNVLYLHHT